MQFLDEASILWVETFVQKEELILVWYKILQGKISNEVYCQHSEAVYLVFYAQSTNTVMLGQTVFCNQIKTHKRFYKKEKKSLFNEYKISWIFSENAVFKLQTDPWLLSTITVLLSVGMIFQTCVYKLIIPFDDDLMIWSFKLVFTSSQSPLIMDQMVDLSNLFRNSQSPLMMDLMIWSFKLVFINSCDRHPWCCPVILTLEGQKSAFLCVKELFLVFFGVHVKEWSIFLCS